MRVSIVFLALAVTLGSAPLTARAADGVPRFEVEENCNAEIADAGETLASCMNDEEEARNELTEHWGECLPRRDDQRRHAELRRAGDLP